jgi:hypothetical protein
MGANVPLAEVGVGGQFLTESAAGWAVLVSPFSGNVYRGSTPLILPSRSVFTSTTATNLSLALCLLLHNVITYIHTVSCGIL